MAFELRDTHDPLQEAIDALAEHDKLERCIDKIHDCQSPHWEILLRSLVKSLTDETIRF